MFNNGLKQVTKSQRLYLNKRNFLYTFAIEISLSFDWIEISRANICLADLVTCKESKSINSNMRKPNENQNQQSCFQIQDYKSEPLGNFWVLVVSLY